jgi:hypothetical protein
VKISQSLNFKKGRSPVKINWFIEFQKWGMSPMIMRPFSSLDRWIAQQVKQTLFLYKLIMQNLNEILLRKRCKERAFVAT